MARVYNKWAVLVVLATALFMINLDVTIVNIALPSLMDDLSASLADAEWVLNAYVLVFAVLLITLGRLGDLFGRKRFFVGGLILFTSASLLCGLAPSISWLVAARGLQAVGGAAMMPATLSILNVTFQGGQRGMAMGIWGAVAGAASALGPIIGGLLVDGFGWQSVFLVNIPIGLAAVYATLKMVPESREPTASRRIDFPGIVTASVALGSLTYALVEGQAYGWSSPLILGLFGLAAAAMMAFIIIERKAAAPLIDLKLFRNVSFSAGNFLGMLLMFGLIGIVFLLVLYLQVVRGYSAIETGLTVLPMPLTLMVVAPLAGRLTDRINMRFVLSAGMLLVAVALYFLSQITPETTRQALIIPLMIAGMGMGLVMAPLGAVVMASAPVNKSGAASGILTTLRQVGATLGISVLGAVLQFKLVDNLTTFFASIPFMPQSAKDAIIEGVSQGGMGGAVTADAPDYLQALIAQVMSEQFTRALSSAMTVAMFICIGGAAVALLINYHPRAQGEAAAAIEAV
ncbi:hypothetical protein DGWBC_0395 [Dehalogenimonas sp. WBC-2]|nr:hypothetical protein DGWBC_0395 [Dehalogenimonas sp. WBC-2]